MSSIDKKNMRDLTAKKLAGGILYVQDKIAEILEARERKLSIRQKWILLTLFCLAGTGAIAFLLFNSFQDPTQIIQPYHFHSPVPLYEYSPDSLSINNFKNNP